MCVSWNGKLKAIIAQQEDRPLVQYPKHTSYTSMACSCDVNARAGDIAYVVVGTTACNADWTAISTMSQYHGIQTLRADMLV